MPNKNPSPFAGMVPKKLPEKETHDPVEASDSPSAPSHGRRSGKLAKTRDKNYRQTNFYVHIDTFADARAKLSKQGPGKDMSDLVNELIAKWLKEPTS